ncbi:hypothetical protein T265_08235 [Opisthorchis viverrini]|uniref:Uncharacterized protein n=1 Tax=Opisthorchis viverrini TaxID=6198 RepID=A0A074ZKU9_OPIVI|nr:hypothetical protein T265_08235 [Opisthorchis viverrini]KER23990.1 hypothetical protein T265_08235 [Opisthorchis viverrini]
MSSNKSETRVQCFPSVWAHQNNYTTTGTRPFKRECEIQVSAALPDWEVMTGGSIDRHKQGESGTPANHIAQA